MRPIGRRTGGLFFTSKRQRLILPMFPLIIPLVIVAVIILVIVMVIRRSRSKSGYSARLSDKESQLARNLVRTVKPQLVVGADVTREQLAQLAGVDAVGTEMYFRFKTLFEKGELTEDRLIHDLEYGGR